MSRLSSAEIFRLNLTLIDVETYFKIKSQPVGFARKCQFPIEEIVKPKRGEPRWLMCEATSVEQSSYCAEHKKICVFVKKLNPIKAVY